MGPGPGVLDVAYVTAAAGVSNTVCTCCRPWVEPTWATIPVFDEDVDRIARRVVEMLRAAKP